MTHFNRIGRAVFPLAVLLFIASPLLPQDKFIPDCPPPFETPSHKRQVDKDCANIGTFVDNDTPEHHAQNRAKNSFCAKGSTDEVATNPISVTVTTFDQLQQSIPADVTFGDSANLPQDRNKLKNIATNADGISIGEGSYVVFVGYMLEAHRGSTESVSCQNGTVGFTDIHIALTGSKTTNLCKSITAEIVPHYRPQLWSRIYYKETYDEIKAHPLRIKGHLFFDGSHRPCGDPQMSSRDPMRRSNWEIHPVYSIDVCSKKSIASCKASNDSVWTPFADWIENQ